MSATKATSEPPRELQRLAFSIAETAEILGISAVSVRRLIGRGLIRANRTLRHIRISQAEIDQFLALS